MKIKNLFLVAALMLFAAVSSQAQATLRSTTLGAAVNDTQKTITVASASGITTGMVVWVRQGREAMIVDAISGTTLTVRRGQNGTFVNSHANAATVWIDLPQYFTTYDRAGTCTSGSEVVLPVINTNNGKVFDCVSSVWVQVNYDTTTRLTSLEFEGSTENTSETTISVTDPTADRTVTIADASGTVFLSSLSTNAPDVANSVWGASNALVFEGATANAFELSLAPADVTADRTVTFADAAGTVFLSSLATNAPDAANSVSGASNALVFEGATADGFETSLTPTDPTADQTVTIPNSTFTLGHITASFVGGAAGTHVDTIFFVADRAYIVTDIDAVWGTAESTGSMDIQVERLQGTEACSGGAGDDLLSAVIDATGTANTVNNGTLAGGGVTALSAGDRLCLNLTATPNEIVNMVVTVGLNPN